MSISQSSFSPTQIFEEGTTEEKGENARLAAFVGAIAVGDLVKSTLGPKGMDKILQSAYVAVLPLSATCGWDAANTDFHATARLARLW